MTPKMVMFEIDVGDSPKLDMVSDKTAENVTGKKTFLNKKTYKFFLKNY